MDEVIIQLDQSDEAIPAYEVSERGAGGCGTGDGGVADLRFQDSTNLSVGPKSSAGLYKFVYDREKSAGSVALQTTRGSFRFVTGSQSKGSYQMKTSYGSPGRTRLKTRSLTPPSVAVPASPHELLTARLDRLGPAKEVAQIGAAIGREFSHALLAAVARKAEAELQSALDRLIDAGLLFRQGVPPHATYLFKHALVQDAAYDTLLREPRRALHARIAEALERRFAEIAETQPELLARHYTEAGLIEKAASLWGKAGQRSLERLALVEASAQLTRAVDQIAALPASPALRREQIKFQVALINALTHTKGHAAPHIKAAAEQQVC